MATRGCTNSAAWNYKSTATEDDGSCEIGGCRDTDNNNEIDENDRARPQFDAKHLPTSQLRRPVRKRAAVAEAASAGREVRAQLGLLLGLALHAVCAGHCGLAVERRGLLASEPCWPGVDHVLDAQRGQPLSLYGHGHSKRGVLHRLMLHRPLQHRPTHITRRLLHGLLWCWRRIGGQLARAQLRLPVRK